MNITENSNSQNANSSNSSSQNFSLFFYFCFFLFFQIRIIIHIFLQFSSIFLYYSNDGYQHSQGPYIFHRTFSPTWMMNIGPFAMAFMPACTWCPRISLPKTRKQLPGRHNLDMLSLCILIILSGNFNLSVSCISSTLLIKQIVFAPHDNLSLSKLCILLLSLCVIVICISDNSWFDRCQSVLIFLIVGIILLIVGFQHHQKWENYWEPASVWFWWCLCKSHLGIS